MKIVRAMKQVARLKGEINVLKKRIDSGLNTLVENDSFNEDSKLLIEELNKKIRKVITLKTQIMHANTKHGMFAKILHLGELKSYIDFLRELEPKTGMIVSGYEHVKTGYKSQITVAEKNQMIEKCQDSINEITDELDDFNAKTDIEDAKTDIEDVAVQLVV